MRLSAFCSGPDYFKYGVRTNEKLNSFSSIRDSSFNSGPHEFEPTPLWA